MPAASLADQVRRAAASDILINTIQNRLQPFPSTLSELALSLPRAARQTKCFQALVAAGGLRSLDLSSLGTSSSSHASAS